MTPVVRLAAAVADALQHGGAVVALESSVLAQGLPPPANREAAERMLKAVTSRGAVPAVTAVVRGVPAAGLDEAEMERILARTGVEKVSARDIPLAMVAGRDGATTVAAALAIAALAGIRVLATGGIGGVHREPAFDESADLLELTRSPLVVVCSGAKSILNLAATVERLETLGIPLIGYRTSELPGFFSGQTGISIAARLDSAAEIAAVARAQHALGRRSSILVVQPPPAAAALPRREVDSAVATAVERAGKAGIRGSAATPFLLAEVDHATAGRSRGANLALLESNAALAADIAVALATG